MHKIYKNGIHGKIGYSIKDSMRANTNQLDYIIKGVPEEHEYCDLYKINKKSIF